MDAINYIAVNTGNKSLQLQRIKRKEQRQAEVLQRRKSQKEYLLESIQRIIGVIIIVLTVIVCSSPMMYMEEFEAQDWTLSLLLIPVGLFLVLSKRCILFGKSK